ncbi:MAG TPA: acetyl-CoA carboxylase biotin carboxylase subunit [Gammaproteobacteria bacterium]|jgi:3-methylcrotonyl-CoA carboxylase alpha subunit
MFKKILIANRGEIACRVMRTCKRLGIQTVAVYSDADRHALHVQMADESLRIGPAKASESYLDWMRILAAAKITHAEAIHPGYGFLSENSEFARQCQQSNIAFIGPWPEAIELMGSKSAAKALMEKAGVPVTPGYHGDDQSLAKLQAEADKIGYPLLIKAVAGGGGKGMRIVNAADEFKVALEGAQREAKAAFGDDHVLLERYIQQPRHIEFQVFGDDHGNVVHLFERECSLQRRFQKVLEETPSPFLDADMRRRMGEAAVAAAKAVKYVNAGTIEFIATPDRSFYFMEMNTRLQVEHPITEETTGQDLVEWQLIVAAGGKLPLSQDKIKQAGHAIEVRLYAENPDKNFLPAPGRLEMFYTPEVDYVRIDTGARSGDDISLFYDPMIAKVTVRGTDRAEAIAHLKTALAETAVFGLTTNLPLLRGIAAHPLFAKGQVDTGFIERELKTLLTRPKLTPVVLAAAVEGTLGPDLDPYPWSADGWRLGSSPGVRFVAREHDGTEHPFIARIGSESSGVTIEVSGESHSVQTSRGAVLFWDDERHMVRDGVAYEFTLTSPYAHKAGRVADAATHPLSPMPGRVVVVHVKAGDKVEVGQALMVLEGMKMEYTVKAAVAGTIEKVLFEAGSMVDADVPLAHIKPE